jgi:hypothetical protein
LRPWEHRLNGGKIVDKTKRDLNGRFAPGCPGGPGRPRRAVEADYLAALSDAVPLKTWKKIVQRAVEDALAGNRHAREWVGNYVLGKPEKNNLLDLAAREMANFDSVSSRACGFAASKRMFDVQTRLFFPEADNGSPSRKAPLSE